VIGFDITTPNMNSDIRVLERQEPETYIAANTIFEPQHQVRVGFVLVKLDDDIILTYLLPMLFSGQRTPPWRIFAPFSKIENAKFEKING
jgi:hypothetical protein